MDFRRKVPACGNGFVIFGESGLSFSAKKCHRPHCSNVRKGAINVDLEHSEHLVQRMMFIADFGYEC
jgi:hypothetical protein